MTTSRMNWVKCLTIAAGLTLGLHANVGTTFAQASDEKTTKGPESERAKAKAEFEAKKADPTVKRVYVIPLRGEFGRDVSATPFRRALQDAKKEQADIIVFAINASFTVNGQTYQEWASIMGQTVWQSQASETARELATMFHEGIRDDADWKTRDGSKPRVVGWVRKAMGPSAMLTLSIPELYFAPDARVGGVGYLNLVFEGVGDEVVREKQRSLRMGRFEGMVRDGGYPVEIVRAMSRSDTLMSVRYEDGKPVFLNDLSGIDILADGADPNRRDTMEQLVRLEGNDVLTLNAKIAGDLGVSKGTAASEDDLVSNLGIERNYVLIGERARKIFADWSEEVSNAEREFAKTFRQYREINVQGRTAAERNTLRGRQLALLNSMKRDIEKYREAINGRNIGGMPDGWISEINVLIDRIKQQMRLDRD
ncbi:MAG: hypothetical protein K2X32_07425 [Phycisphaerales bacterium]|nr:hypothetical protein [Phycisphaerales bacterium]